MRDIKLMREIGSTEPPIPEDSHILIPGLPGRRTIMGADTSTYPGSEGALIDQICTGPEIEGC